MAERRASPLVEQFRRGAVPVELRLLAAQGALPLGPADLLELLADLTAGPDERVRTAADYAVDAELLSWISNVTPVRPVGQDRAEAVRRP